MNHSLLKSNLIAVKADSDRLLEVVLPQYKATLVNFAESLTKLSNFICDDRNINALKDSERKLSQNEDLSPLDILSRDLISRLVIIEPLLSTSVFNYMRQENQPYVDAAGRHVMPSEQYNQNQLNALNNAINNLFANNLPSVFEVLKHLGGHNRTLIILGSNGSGKTSFANYLKGIESHIKVIPASKPIKVMGHISNIFGSTIDRYNSEVYQGGDLREDLLHKLIVGICTDHDNAARKYYDTGNKEETTYEKIKIIFDDFFDVQLDNSDFGNKVIKGKKHEADSYHFNNMSDGERAAFFYIATVVVAPPQSFIVVDEPENHLNPAIYNKIWDRLMEVRNDCQFIFISHTMEFINARSDFELVKIKNFTYPDKFEFEFLGSTLEDLSSDFIVEVIGSRRPILFCEGSKTDYDYKVYETLFCNEYTVIPTGNCSSVENSVEACNMHATTYSIQQAVGIIDSDLKSETEAERLKAKKIFTLRCNEIEMLLLDEAIFKKVLARIFKSETEFENFKIAFFRKLTERKHHIIKRLVKTQIDEKLRSSVIDDKANKTQSELKANLSNIFGSLDVDTLWGNSERIISDIISNQDYDSALKYCCLEHSEVILGVGKPFVTDYATIALGVLKEDASLVVAIKTKYFSDFHF